MKSDNICKYCANKNDATKCCHGCYNHNNFQGIEVEQVIHCKDCKHKGERWKDDKCLCEKMTNGCGVKFMVTEEYFCGSGEKTVMSDAR